MAYSMEVRKLLSPWVLGSFLEEIQNVCEITLCQVCFNRERAKTYSSFTGRPWRKIFALKI